MKLKLKHKYAILTILCLIFVVWQIATMVTPPKGAIDIDAMEVVAYSDFESDVESKEISIVYFSDNCAEVYAKLSDGSYYRTANPEYDTFKKDLLDAGVDVQSAVEFVGAQKPQTNDWSLLLFVISFMTMISLAIRWIYATIIEKTSNDDGLAVAHSSGGPNNTSASISTTTSNKNVKRFKDIAGLYEVKKDMQCLVDFLKNKEKYTEAGATLPKGVIFYGPPGTGKTLLAKALAGEAGVPFHYMSGSDFIETYVGTGAKRVRELFAKAKEKTPCIIFIDEIDAIGGNRSRDDSSGEDRKTINALLTEMDGFKPAENILVIAATNRLEDLDPALTRPGRFTNKFCVPLPETPKERLEIIRLYQKNKKFAEDVDFNALAKETMGFSPASIEALLNEAAIISVQDNKKCIDKATIDKAMFKVLLSGHVKENQADRNREELELVAWHEAGHALIGKLNGKSIPKVTILATTSGAGGVTFTTPKSTALYSINDLKAEVAELYAGRAAELMLLKDKNKVTTGASNDIQKATNIIKEIVTSYGMSEEFGMLNLNQLQVNQSRIIEEEVKLAKEIEANTIATLTKHYNQLKQIAESLLANETLYEQDLNEIMLEISEKERETPSCIKTPTKNQPTKTTRQTQKLGTQNVANIKRRKPNGKELLEIILSRKRLAKS